jgi:hypothetical protein
VSHGPAGLVRTRFGAALAVCILAAAVVLVIAVWPRPGTSGWTGVAVTVPSCPTGAEGCRVFLTHASDGSADGHDDWRGPATTLKFVLPAGRYAVSAEGCTGDRIANDQISVTSGFHTEIDLGSAWQMPGFPGRACPGFIPAASS